MSINMTAYLQYLILNLMYAKKNIYSISFQESKRSRAGKKNSAHTQYKKNPVDQSQNKFHCDLKSSPVGQMSVSRIRVNAPPQSEREKFRDPVRN